ncbi:hypothetical protein EDC26_11011 [Paralcaligenes ureilyticus]|uniref:Uncharacterized protein n=1 Tax=Paralcaligenes ureilyticus TaxID=627131 RepID=A0A4R3LXB7_9BURK|nr:hypothetical protein EDC26_11011 [Paralcaligenes ureilyticus]
MASFYKCLSALNGFGSHKGCHYMSSRQVFVAAPLVGAIREWAAIRSMQPPRRARRVIFGITFIAVRVILVIVFRFVAIAVVRHRFIA